MHARAGAGLAFGNDGVDGFAEAAARASLGLGGGPCQLALVFAGQENLDHVEEGLAAVHDRLHPEALVGCGAQGVVGSGRELEDGGVAVWAASLDAEVDPLHVQVGRAGEAVVVSGVPDLDGADAAILLADPFILRDAPGPAAPPPPPSRFPLPAEPPLSQLSGARPNLPVVGGMASGSGLLL